MIPVQASEEQYSFQDIQELAKQFKTYKQNYGKKQLNHTEFLEKIEPLIIKLKELLNGRDIEQEFYSYCLKNHPELNNLAKNFIQRTKKKDVHCAIEGETGSGKSTLTLCVMLLLSHLRRKQFSLSKNVLYLPKQAELSARLDGLADYEILWVDETISSLYKMYFAQKDAIASNQTVQQERFRHNIVLYCIPNFNHLLKDFRDTNIKFRIWTIATDPSAAVLWVKEKHPATILKYGAWHMDERAKQLKKGNITPLSTTFEYLSIERKISNTAMVLNWPDMENIPQFSAIHLLYEIYKKQSRVSVRKFEAENEPIPGTKNQDKYKALADGLLKMTWKENKNITATEIMAKWKEEFKTDFPFSRDYINRRLAKCRKAALEDDTIINNTILVTPKSATT